MPDKLNFNHLGDKVICIEKDCDYGGFLWQMPEEKKYKHFLTHYNEAQILANKEGMLYEITGDVRTQACRVCGNEFSQPRRRGRPRLACEVCSGK